MPQSRIDKQRPTPSQRGECPVPIDCPNLTELVSRNAELMKENAELSEAIASRDAFLAIAAHELRNPMTAIGGRMSYLRLLVKKPGISAQKVEESCEQLEWLISRYIQRATVLLDISRINGGNFRFSPSLVDVCSLIKEVAESVRPLAEHAGSDLSYTLPDAGLTLQTDQLSLEQILDNLLTNAIKYGGSAPITVEACSDLMANVAIIRVQDRGPGIAAADQARIFAKFERAVRPGHTITGFGIGLWIVRQLTEGLGGTITVKSEPGLGSTFTIIMPLQLEKDTE